MRFALIRQLFIGELKPALFTDVGVSTDDFVFTDEERKNPLASSRYAFSVGAGLRYVLPVGPLCVDVAYAPFHGTGDSPFRVYVMLGYIF